MSKKGVSRWVAAEYVWDVLMAVVLPPVLLALLGRWLDQRFHYHYLFTLLGLFLSLLIVWRLMVDKAKRFKELYKDSSSP